MRATKLNLITATLLGGATGGVALWLGGESMAVLVRKIFGPSMMGSDSVTWLVFQRVALGAWLGSILAALAFRKRDSPFAIKLR